MDLNQKYELLEGLSSGGAGIFRARERSSEIEVLVHFLGMNGEAEHLMEQVRTLPPGAREHILEFGDHNGRPFVVTDPCAQPLQQWLSEALSPSEALSEEKPATQPDRVARAGAWKLPVLPETPAPGDFTQMFQSPPVPAVTQALPVPPVASPLASASYAASSQAASSQAASPQASPPAPSAPAEDGEFTRLFRAAEAPQVPNRPYVPPASTVPAADPGAFTRMFQSPKSEETFAPRPSPPLVAQPAPAPGPGEFTRIFQSPAPGEAFVPRPAAPPVAHTPAPADPGEFTRMFQSPATTPGTPVSFAPSSFAPSSFAPSPMPSSPAVPAGATGAFGGMRLPEPAAPAASPGDYTRMISVQTPQAPAAALPPSAPAPSVAGKKNLNIALLVAIFEGVVILALLLVLFFALKK